jgi:Ca2+-binding RTX toxin-like protein
MAISLKSVANSLADILDNIQNSVKNQIWGSEQIPLVGTQLSIAPNVSFFQPLIDRLGSTDDRELSSEDVAGAINNVLKEVDPRAKFSNTFKFTLDGSTELGKVAIAKDVGLPNLGLSIEGDAGVNLGYIVNFGVSITGDRFQLLPTDNKELTLTLNGTLDNASNDQGFSLKGDMGLLQFQAKDKRREPELNATFAVDVSPTGAITADITGGLNLGLQLETGFNESGPKPLIGLPKVQFGLEVQWDFGKATLGAGDRSILWGNKPTFDFKDITIDFGTFFTDFARPLLQGVQFVSKPLAPFTEALVADIKVFRDLGITTVFDSDGDGKATLIDLIDSLSDNIDTNLLKNIAILNNSINSLGDFISQDNPNTQNLNLLLGNVSFKDLDFKNPVFTPQDSITEERKTSALIALDQKLNDPTDPRKGYGQFTREWKTLPGGGLKFALLEDPFSVINLFTGQPLDLFSYDAPAFSGEVNFKRFFPVTGPIGVTFEGDLKADANFDFGFDTVGLTKLKESGNPLDLLESFYVSDFKNGEDTPEASIQAAIKAFGTLEGGVARGGVGGGIYANMWADLVDSTPDGKIRGSDIFGKNPLALFNLGGEFTTGLETYAEIGWPDAGLGQRWTWESAKVKLGGFNTSLMGGDRAPTLATQISDGSLQLNMGSNAAQRARFNTEDGYEDFQVQGTATAAAFSSQRTSVFALASAAPLTSVQISAFGFTQTYSGFTRIVADGGQGDTILELSNIFVPTVLSGGNGNDLIRGGTLNDEISGGSGWDRLHGNAGDDRLSGGRGDDMLYGGDGVDSLFGNEDNDILLAGAGDDFGDGGDGSDRLNGADGNDLLLGGLGDDILAGEAGNDILRGQAGNDDLYGGDGDDDLVGGTGADLISGGAGRDTTSFRDSTAGVFLSLKSGGWGGDAAGDRFESIEVLELTNFDDYAIGDDNNNEIDGLGGNDTLEGYAGDDTLIGNDGNDRIVGGLGNDTQIGGLGDDTHYAELGNDEVIDLAGNNYIDAGEGDNLVIAGAGNDTIVAGRGNDRINAGNGNNTVRAGEGHNWIITGLGNDIVYDGAGNDSVFTGAGDDIIYLAEGRNFVDAGIGNNTIYSGSGSDLFVLTLGEGASTIIQFQVNDRFGLVGGLSYDDLLINPGNGNQGFFSQISIASTGDLLGIVNWVQPNLLTKDLFVPVDYPGATTPIALGASDVQSLGASAGRTSNWIPGLTTQDQGLYVPATGDLNRQLIGNSSIFG